MIKTRKSCYLNSRQHYTNIGHSEKVFSKNDTSKHFLPKNKVELLEGGL